LQLDYYTTLRVIAQVELLRTVGECGQILRFAFFENVLGFVVVGIYTLLDLMESEPI